jgi:hypothetical protein
MWDTNKVKSFTKWLLSLILTVWLSYWLLQAWNWLTATTWDSLTAEKWNNLVTRLETLESEHDLSYEADGITQSGPVNYPWCDTPDITTWTITISACNVWTNTAWITATSYGKYFQFGKNQNTDDSWDQWSVDWATPIGIDGASANLWWVMNADKTTATYVNSTEANKTLMQWPCATWYHIPTSKEWVDLYTAWNWWMDWSSMSTALKLPLAGFRYWDDGSMNIQGSYAYYWSASPNDSSTYTMYFTSTSIYPSDSNHRTAGSSIRCFKN